VASAACAGAAAALRLPGAPALVAQGSVQGRPGDRAGLSRTSGARRRPVLATSADEKLAMQPWSPGPVLVQSGVARRVQSQLKHDPLLLMFDATVKEELAKFSSQREKEAGLRHYSPPGAVGEATMMLTLRRQIMRVKRVERRAAVAELLYLMVCSRFKLLDVHFLPSMRPHIAGSRVTSIQAEGRQWGLTDIYSLEALELVRDHLLRMLDSSRMATREAGAMRLALFQAGQTYAMSMLFGYYLRRMDARYQMDKLVGALGKPVAAPERPPSEAPATKRRRPVPDWMDPHWTKGEVRVEQSLADYIKGFGAEELRTIRTVASAEAQAAMEAQVYALFGNLKELKLQLLGVVGRVSSNEELAQKIRGAIDSERVDSVRLTGEDFRRLVLESVAFGSLLCDSEMEANTVYELTAPKSPPSGSANNEGGFGGAFGR